MLVRRLKRVLFGQKKSSNSSPSQRQRQSSQDRPPVEQAVKPTDRQKIVLHRAQAETEKPPRMVRRRRPSQTATRLRQRHKSPIQRAPLNPSIAISENANPSLSPPSDRFAERAPQRRKRSQRVFARDRAQTSPPSLPEQKAQTLALRKFLLYALRLLILGIGLGAISGTLLSALQKTYVPLSAEANSAKEAAAVPARPPALPLKQESAELKTQVQALLARSPQFQAGVILADLDTGVYLNIEGATTFAAASTIKLPILVAFFQDVDAGKISLEEMLTMKEEAIAGEAGTMQYKKPGTQFSAIETVTQMITISDNTATNMIIERLGGAESLNQRFRQWGLHATAIRNLLPDVEGTNSTSPMDLAKLLARVNRGELVSMRSRDRLLDIMSHIVTNDLLPRGLDENAKIAHKTGNIGSLIADAGAIDTPTGKRYIAVVMVKRPHNDPKAKDLIRAISRSAYQYFNRPTPASQATPTPSVTTTPAGTANSMAAGNQE